MINICAAKLKLSRARGKKTVLVLEVWMHISKCLCSSTKRTCLRMLISPTQTLSCKLLSKQPSLVFKMQASWSHAEGITSFHLEEECDRSQNHAVGRSGMPCQAALWRELPPCTCRQGGMGETRCGSGDNVWGKRLRVRQGVTCEGDNVWGS